MKSTQFDEGGGRRRRRRRQGCRLAGAIAQRLQKTARGAKKGCFRAILGSMHHPHPLRAAKKGGTPPPSAQRLRGGQQLDIPGDVRLFVDLDGIIDVLRVDSAVQNYFSYSNICVEMGIVSKRYGDGC